MPIWALAGLGDESRSLVGAADKAAAAYTPSSYVCDVKSYTYGPMHGGPGKGCPAGAYQVEEDLGLTIDANGRRVCATRLSCKINPGVSPGRQFEQPTEPAKESGTPWFLWALVGVGVLGMVAQASKDDGFERNGRSRKRRRNRRILGDWYVRDARDRMHGKPAVRGLQERDGRRRGPGGPL